ncbi:MAG: succinate dehydrogenase cytochrome b subunit [Polyangiaceae bacterium]
MLSSSLGRKFVMALTGLFLISFLVVHLSGNLLLFKEDGGAAFNAYAHFMASNGIVRILEIGLFAGIVFHFAEGVSLVLKNRAARPNRYAGAKANGSTWSSRYMGALGGVITVFLVLHLSDFFYKSRIATPGEGLVDVIDAEGTRNMYAAVRDSFAVGWYSSVYIVCMVALGFHLVHGFRSAFQTLGLSHRGYALLVRRASAAFAVLVPLAFASMPIYFYFRSLN